VSAFQQTPEDEALALQMPGRRLARGVARRFSQFGWCSLLEFRLKTGRRVDVISLAPDGVITVVEVKSSTADFRSDQKWWDYLEFCDRFFFAVPADFPRELLPGDCGLIVADPYDAEILREAPVEKLPAARRKAMTLKFARTAAQRLLGHEDPFHQESG
jgi:hypothetical protein